MAEKKDGVCRMVGSPQPFDADGYDGEPPEMQPLSRDQILGIQDAGEIMILPVPEWGGVVGIKTIMSGEWDDFEASLVTVENGTARKADLKDGRAKFAVLVCCDPATGDPLFTNADVPVLTRKSRRALDRILEAGKKHNRISDGDDEALVASLKQTPDGDS